MENRTGDGSSAAVYGKYSGKAFYEDKKTAPESLYGVSKFSGEMFVNQILNPTNVKTIIFRLFNTYGPGENLNNPKKGMVSIYSSYVWKKKPIVVKGSLKRFRDFIYIKDYVNILAKSISTKLKGRSEIFNLSFGENYSVRSLIKKIILASNNKKNYPIKISKGTKDDSFGFHASTTKLKKFFKLKPRYNLNRGLAEYFTWINKIPKNSNLKKYHPFIIKN